MENKIINIPSDILGWLKNRSISDEIILQSKLSWNGNEIVIPVFDKNGILLFSKYRRNPFSNEGPKYRYEKGSTSSLYNLQTLKDNEEKPIFICEGELDALLLSSLNLVAVTSTGGSSTFKKEWAEYFVDKMVYIVFDRDEAGYKGAMKVQGLIPHAKMIILPDDFEGNDLTDYFQKFNLCDFFKLNAQSYFVPREPQGIPTEKCELRKLVKTFGDAADLLLETKREFFNTKKSTRHVFIMLNYINSRYETYNNILKSFDNKKLYHNDDSEIIKAKEVPISNFIEFNYDGFANCLWHKEKNNSMKYNQPGTKYGNTVKCYGCGMMGSTIDVVMKKHNLGFINAVKFILNK